MSKHQVRVASLVALLAGGCLNHLDDRKVEQEIETFLKSKGVTIKSVDCPPDRPLKKDDTFTCSGIDADNEALVFRVKQTDGHGAIFWEMDGMLINQQKVGDGIERQVGTKVDVQCPEKSLIMKVGSSFTCPVLVKGKTEHVLLTLVNDKGDVTWKPVP
jgi:hypothetical protein